MTPARLEDSIALWNRRVFDLNSNEMLAQILDRGDMTDWRALFRTAAADPGLRARIMLVIRTVPIPTPRFWLAALASLGERVDFDEPLPSYGQGGP